MTKNQNLIHVHMSYFIDHVFEVLTVSVLYQILWIAFHCIFYLCQTVNKIMCVWFSRIFTLILCWLFSMKFKANHINCKAFFTIIKTVMEFRYTILLYYYVSSDYLCTILRPLCPFFVQYYKLPQKSLRSYLHVHVYQRRPRTIMVYQKPKH